VRHADYIHAPRAIHVRFRYGRERRPLHTQIRSATMNLHLNSLARFFQDIAEMLADGMRESHMRHESVSKGCRLMRPRTRAVKELFGNNHVSWRVLLLQRANCLSRKNPLDAEQLHAIDIRADTH